MRYIDHTLTDNRHGRVVNTIVMRVDGYAERDAAKQMIGDARQAVSADTQVTLGADKGYNAREVINTLDEFKVVAHVAGNTSERRSAVPEQTVAARGYAVSQRWRKVIDQVFSWVGTRSGVFGK